MDCNDNDTFVSAAWQHSYIEDQTLACSPAPVTASTAVKGKRLSRESLGLVPTQFLCEIERTTDWGPSIDFGDVSLGLDKSSRLQEIQRHEIESTADWGPSIDFGDVSLGLDKSSRLPDESESLHGDACGTKHNSQLVHCITEIEQNDLEPLGSPVRLEQKAHACLAKDEKCPESYSSTKGDEQELCGPIGSMKDLEQDSSGSPPPAQGIISPCGPIVSAESRDLFQSFGPARYDKEEPFESLCETKVDEQESFGSASSARDARQDPFGSYGSTKKDQQKPFEVFPPAAGIQHPFASFSSSRGQDLFGSFGSANFNEEDFIADAGAAAALLDAGEEEFNREALLIDQLGNESNITIRNDDQTFANMTISTYMGTRSQPTGSLSSHDCRPDIGLPADSPPKGRQVIPVYIPEEVSNADSMDYSGGSSVPQSDKTPAPALPAACAGLRNENKTVAEFGSVEEESGSQAGQGLLASGGSVSIHEDLASCPSYATSDHSDEDSGELTFSFLHELIQSDLDLSEMFGSGPGQFANILSEMKRRTRKKISTNRYTTKDMGETSKETTYGNTTMGASDVTVKETSCVKNPIGENTSGVGMEASRGISTRTSHGTTTSETTVEAVSGIINETTIGPISASSTKLRSNLSDSSIFKVPYPVSPKKAHSRKEKKSARSFLPRPVSSSSIAGKAARSSPGLLTPKDNTAAIVDHVRQKTKKIAISGDQLDISSANDSGCFKSGDRQLDLTSAGEKSWADLTLREVTLPQHRDSSTVAGDYFPVSHQHNTTQPHQPQQNTSAHFTNTTTTAAQPQPHRRTCHPPTTTGKNYPCLEVTKESLPSQRNAGRAIVVSLSSGFQELPEVVAGSMCERTSPPTDGLCGMPAEISTAQQWPQVTSSSMLPSGNAWALLDNTADATSVCDTTVDPQMQTLVAADTSSQFVDKFASSGAVPGRDDDRWIDLVGRTDSLPAVSPRTALELVDVPDQVRVSEVCCVSLSTTVKLPITSMSTREVKCELTVREVALPCRETLSSQTVCPFDVEKEVTLYPGTSESVVIRFQPKDQGMYTAVLEVRAMTMADLKVHRVHNVALSGCAQFPLLKMSPASEDIDFGNMLWGTTECRSLHIKNIGQARVPINLSISRKESSQCSFSLCLESPEGESSTLVTSQSPGLTSVGGSELSLSLPGTPPGHEAKTETVKVYCKPHIPNSEEHKHLEKAETFQAVLTLALGQAVGDILPLAEVNLRVKAGHYKLQVDKSDLNIVAAPRGRAEATVKLINPGSIPMPVDLCLEPAREPFSMSVAGRVLVPPRGASVPVTVVFAPQPSSWETGDYHAQLMLSTKTSTTPVKNYYIPVTGSLRRTSVKIKCNTTQLSFGATDVGHTCKEKLLIQADTDMELQISIRQPAQIFFLLQPDSEIATSSLRLMARRDVKHAVCVAFTPANVTAYSADLIIQDMNNRHIIKLRGYGGCSHLVLEQPSPAEAGIYSLDLGPLRPERPLFHYFVVRNEGTRCGFIRTTFCDLGKSEVQPTRASVMPPGCILAPGETQELLVMFRPSHREVELCKAGHALVAYIKLEYGDNTARELFLRSPGKQPRSVVSGYQIPVTSKQWPLVDTEMAGVSAALDTYVFLRKSMKTLKIGVFGEPRVFGEPLAEREGGRARAQLSDISRQQPQPMYPTEKLVASIRPALSQISTNISPRPGPSVCADISSSGKKQLPTQCEEQAVSSGLKVSTRHNDGGDHKLDVITFPTTRVTDINTSPAREVHWSPTKGQTDTGNSDVRSEDSKMCRTKGLHLVQSDLEFTPLPVGTSCVSKLYIKNQTMRDAQLTVEEPKPPFLTRNLKFKVSANKMMMYPVTFKPRHVGCFKEQITLRDSVSGTVLIATLSAKSTPQTGGRLA